MSRPSYGVFGLLVFWAAAGFVLCFSPAYGGNPIVVAPNDYWYNYSFGAGPSPMQCSDVFVDGSHERQWYMGEDGMNLARAWSISTGSPTCMIAILDDPYDIYHYDLADRLDVANAFNFRHDIADVSIQSSASTSTHGTTMASIFAASTNNEPWWQQGEVPQSNGPYRAGVSGITWEGEVLPLVATGGGEVETDAGPLPYIFGDVIRGLWWVAQKHDSGLPIRVVNMSLASVRRMHFCPGDTTNLNLSSNRYHLFYYRLMDVFQELESRGIVCVVGAGNNNLEWENSLSIGDNVLVVSGVTLERDEFTQEVSYVRWGNPAGGGGSGTGANWHSTVDVCGYVVRSANYWPDYHPFEPPRYQPMALATFQHPAPLPPDVQFCGQATAAVPDHGSIVAPTMMMTSGATAQGTGVAALVASVYPALSAQQIIEMVKRGAVSVDGDNATNCGGSGCDGLLGAGRLDAYRALTMWGTLRDTVLSGDVWISGDVMIPSDAEVTLLPGTRVHVAPDDVLGSARCEIVVDGTLSILGTATQKVAIEAFCHNKSSSDWGGIIVNGNAGAVNVENAVVRNAAFGVYAETGVSISGSKFEMCDSGIVINTSESSVIGPGVDIDDCSASAVVIVGGDVVVDGLAVQDSGLHGLVLDGVDVNSFCDNLSISRCSGDGVRVEGGHVTFGTNVQVSESGNAGMSVEGAVSVGIAGFEMNNNNTAFRVGIPASLSIRNTEISGGNFAISCGGQVDAGTTHDYGNNAFSLGYRSGIYGYLWDTQASLSLVGNCFEGRTTMSGPRIISNSQNPVPALPGFCN